jgi:23S rRNA (adenine-N6)-dimethyltransferase
VAGQATWGWHRLDSRWVKRLVDAADVAAGDLVLDVGAGDGRIAREALARGARVIAVELHPGRAAELRRSLAGGDAVVVQADAADLRLPRRPFKVVANPPFAITAALLRRLTAPQSRLEAASVVLPAWAVARWTAGRGVGGVTSRRAYRYARGGQIPARAFSPPPPHPVGVLLITRG